MNKDKVREDLKERLITLKIEKKNLSIGVDRFKRKYDKTLKNKYAVRIVESIEKARAIDKKIDLIEEILSTWNVEKISEIVTKYNNEMSKEK